MWLENAIHALFEKFFKLNPNYTGITQWWNPAAYFSFCQNNFGSLASAERPLESALTVLMAHPEFVFVSAFYIFFGWLIFHCLVIVPFRFVRRICRVR